MEKQTKNIITRKWVEKKLHFYNSADMKAGLLLCAIITAVCGILTAIVVGVTLTSAESLISKIVFSIIGGGVFVAPIVVVFCQLGNTVAEKKLLDRGEFDIVTRKLSYKKERVTRRNIILLLKFPDFSERSVDQTTYFHAGIGDEFYIVVYRTNRKKQRIKMLYSAKMYEYVTE